ncbi:MAG TPA: bifunctional metallophosphatase/5'-nucleotidase [Anaerolineaceae bacterium]
MSLRKLFLPVSILIILAFVLSSVTSAEAHRSRTVNVQILALNDFHGNLEPPSGSSGRIGTIDAGGVEYLATHIKNLRQENRNTVVVSAGDLIGASPLLSALFHDEPTIEAFNLIGLDYNAVGNHEFDEGVTELLRMQRGGCHPVDGCQDGDGFRGARFKFLAANVSYNKNGRTIFPAYRVENFQGAKVAFIGLTLEGTPSIVTPSGISNVSFADEADTINALVPHLKRRGVNTIVVLIHEGGAQVPSGGINECNGISGAIVDIVNRTSDEVDLFISGHTHNAYNCVIDGRVVTSASSFGRLVTDIDLQIDTRTGQPTQIQAENLIVTRDVTPAARLTALINKYREISAPLANRIIGQITATITRTANAAGESPLGDVIADAQLAATTAPELGGAQIAFMNPGGIRADLTYAASGSEGDGNVTYAESFTVQPFGNSLVTMTLTGQQIKDVLEQQFDNPAPGQMRILQVSEGFTYTWSQSAPVGSKISNMMLNGVPIDLNATYRVTVNSFLADGGDNFTVLRQGTDRLGGAVDTDALEAYFIANSPVAPGPVDRITVVP